MQPYWNPCLPQNPQWAHQQPQNGEYQNPSYSSHYMQAYMQSQAGYRHHHQQAPQPHPHYPNLPLNHQPRPGLPLGQWYQPGHKRCTYRGCTFTGSHSSVEIHMMDRHLIYPPGWEKRQKKQEWDADPSLKGKPIPIQGTNATLDDPEQLAAWIADRKKRFPTSNRVEDKKRKMDEAVARGQLTAEDIGLHPEKRRKIHSSNHDSTNANLIPIHPNSRGGSGSGRGRGGSRGRGRGGSATTAPIPPTPLPQKPKTVVLPPRPIVVAFTASSSDDNKTSSSDSEGEPEEQTSKRDIVSSETSPEDADNASPPVVPVQKEPAATEHGVQPQQRKRPPPQPKKAPWNPFAARPSLLRNLIVPEIRVTVSNLSQAIRFLVDNDFLRGVELKPGEASEAKIQVLNNYQEKPEYGE